MAHIQFTVPYRFDASAERVWEEMIDWSGHAKWIPATRVEVGPGDPTAPGATFTAWTGFGKLALEDRMRVVSCDWNDETRSGSCEVEKLGPVLVGRAGFTVSAANTPDGDPDGDLDGDQAQLEWVEDVAMRRLPQFVAPVAAKLGALGFKQGMRKLNKLLGA